MVYNKNNIQSKMAVFGTAEYWQRPASINFPRLWKRFEAFSTISRKVEKYWIQDIPEYMYEEVIDLISERFYYSEPIRVYTHFLSDRESVAEEKELWRQALKQRLSIICYAEKEGSSPEIVSIYISCRRTKYDPQREFQGKTIRKIALLTSCVVQEKYLFEKFNVAEMVIGIAGVTYPRYYLPQVIANMLECRAMISLQSGIRTAFAFATSEVAKLAASKSGFKLFTSITYEKLGSIDSRLQMFGIGPNAKCVYLMYKCYI